MTPRSSRRSRKSCALAAVLFAIALSAGCDEKLRDLTGPTPDLQPTFTSIQREIFASTDLAGRTACVSCHTNVGRPAPAGLVLLEGSAYAALVNVPSTTKPGAIRVIPGDPENSYLIHKLEGRPGIVGLRMPRNQGPFLTEGQMLVLERWIAIGAPNN